MKKKMLSIILAAMMAGTMATGCGADGGKRKRIIRTALLYW